MYSVEVYYSKTEGGKPVRAMGFGNPSNLSGSHRIDSIASDYGEGYYYFRVHTESKDIGTISTSDWSEFSPAYSLHRRRTPASSCPPRQTCAGIRRAITAALSIGASTAARRTISKSAITAKVRVRRSIKRGRTGTLTAGSRFSYMSMAAAPTTSLYRTSATGSVTLTAILPHPPHGSIWCPLSSLDRYPDWLGGIGPTSVGHRWQILMMFTAITSRPIILQLRMDK